jgi:hypothetical protein
MDLNDIRKMSFYILNIIKELQKPADDSEWLEWHNQVEIDFKTSNEDLSIFLTEFFPIFFRKVFERMTIIKEEIETYKNSPEYNQLRKMI